MGTQVEVRKFATQTSAGKGPVIGVGESEYLKRDKIPDITYRINDTEIYIGDESTIYLQTKRREFPTQTQFLDIYSDAYQRLKDLKTQGVNVKISYKNGYKKKVVTAWPQIENEYATYKEEYMKLKEIAKQIEKRGLRWGVTDDKLLKEAIKQSDKVSRNYPALSRLNSIIFELNKIILGNYKGVVALTVYL